MQIKDEWPTLALLGLVYGTFASLTYCAEHLPGLAVVMGLAAIIALHSSVQHEVLHGHPFNSSRLNDLTVFPALGLFVPYLRFKDTHLDHHYDPNLTDPYDDPESNYLDRILWAKLPAPVQALARANNTLLGRMLIGPALSLGLLYVGDARALIKGVRRIWRSYLEHALGVALVVGWLLWVCDFAFWVYCLAAYLAMSLLKIRTFLEHRAHERAAARSVIIEDKGLLAFLFLYNNYHAVHHAHPNVAWHRLPRMYHARRDVFLARNGGYSYPSYAAVFRQFFLRSKDTVPHPFWTVTNRTTPPRT